MSAGSRSNLGLRIESQGNRDGARTVPNRQRSLSLKRDGQLGQRGTCSISEADARRPRCRTGAVLYVHGYGRQRRYRRIYDRVSGCARSGDVAKHFAEHEVYAHRVFVVSRLGCNEQVILAWTPLAALTAGVASSLGPCVAPRFLAAAAMCAGTSGRRRWGRLAAFVAGLCASYALACSAGGLLARWGAYSASAYGLMALVCCTAGVVTILRGRACGTRHAQRSFGGTFLSATAFVGVGSPCCGPLALVAGFGWWGAGSNVLVPLAFALGHAAPLVGLALGSTQIERFASVRWPSAATATVAGGLAIALGSYYGLLA